MQLQEDYVCWPMLDAEIEEVVNGCQQSCQKKFFFATVCTPTPRLTIHHETQVFDVGGCSFKMDSRSIVLGLYHFKQEQLRGHEAYLEFQKDCDQHILRE